MKKHAYPHGQKEAVTEETWESYVSALEPKESAAAWAYTDAVEHDVKKLEELLKKSKEQGVEQFLQNIQDFCNQRKKFLTYAGKHMP